MGFLFKSEYSHLYEVSPTEGGHSEYSPRNDEDFEFLKFAKKYIEESKNVENLRAHGKVYRVSIERVGAGPAVPMIYKFLSEKNKDLVDSFAKEGKNFDDITSYDIIDRAMK
jgi:glucokinase